MIRGEPSSWIRWSAAVVSTALILAGSVAPSAEQASGQPRAVFRQGTELILVNVVVRDTRGVVVRGLTKNDFSILEDNKPQTISTFDFEDLSTPATSRPGATSPPLPVILGAPRQTVAPSPLPAASIDARGHRLLVLLFDLSSMQPEEIQRAIDAARA